MKDAPSRPDPDPGDSAPAVVAALLQPIPGSSPGGRNVQHEGDYGRINEARRDENANLPQGVWVRAVKQADWALVERLCVDTLTLRSKDLRIACWLSEAWVHLGGFAGLANGLALIDGLCRRFWNDLHPLIEGNDPAGRAAAIDWLNQRLPVALRQVPIVIHAAQPDTRFTWSSYLDAQRLDGIRRHDAAAAQRSEASGAVTLAMFQSCQERTSPAVFSAIAADLDSTAAGLARLDSTLDDYFGREAPGLGKIRAVVDDIAAFAAASLVARHIVASPAMKVDVGGTNASPRDGAKIAVVDNPPFTRESAYRQLAAIACYLRETEPHSPVPYVLADLVDWGRMSLPDLDAALRDQGSSISTLLEVLGLDPIRDSLERDTVVID